MTEKIKRIVAWSLVLGIQLFYIIIGWLSIVGVLSGLLNIIISACLGAVIVGGSLLVVLEAAMYIGLLD